MTPIKTLLIERLFIVNKKTNLFDGHPHKITDWDWALNETEALLAKTKRSYKRLDWYTIGVCFFALANYGLTVYYKWSAYKLLLPAVLFFSALDRLSEKKQLLIAVEEEFFLLKVIKELENTETAGNNTIEQ
jgi:hypothetical protein